MPPSLTSPEIEQRPQVHDGDQSTGSRPPGLPPQDKRTGGGGSGDGDDDWDSRPVGQRGPRERLRQFRIGLVFALSGIALYFVALMTAFIAGKSNYRVDQYARVINEWLPTALPSILWLNTAALMLSSVTAEFARQAMFREHEGIDEWLGLGKPISRRAAIWISATLLLGTVFFVGQWVAWDQLHAQHVYYSGGASARFFFLLTVTHACHLFLGLVGLIVTLGVLRNSRQFATRQILVDTTVWYWHAMGMLWLILFILLEFFQ